MPGSLTGSHAWERSTSQQGLRYLPQPPSETRREEISHQECIPGRSFPVVMVEIDIDVIYFVGHLDDPRSSLPQLLLAVLVVVAFVFLGPCASFRQVPATEAHVAD